MSVEVAGSWQPRSRIVLEFAIHLIAKDGDTVFAGELQHGFKDMSWHQEPRRIVWCVDVEDSRAGLDQFFESVEVVGPAILGAAAPLAYLSAGTAR